MKAKCRKRLECIPGLKQLRHVLFGSMKLFSKQINSVNIANNVYNKSSKARIRDNTKICKGIKIDNKIQKWNICINILSNKDL